MIRIPLHVIIAELAFSGRIPFFFSLSHVTRARPSRQFSLRLQQAASLVSTQAVSSRLPYPNTFLSLNLLICPLVCACEKAYYSAHWFVHSARKPTLPVGLCRACETALWFVHPNQMCEKPKSWQTKVEVLSSSITHSLAQLFS